MRAWSCNRRRCIPFRRTRWGSITWAWSGSSATSESSSQVSRSIDKPRAASDSSALAPARQTQVVHVGPWCDEAPLVVARDQPGLATQLDMADAGQHRVVEDIVNQLAPEACVPVRLGDDHIEDQCLEDTVGQD